MLTMTAIVKITNKNAQQHTSEKIGMCKVIGTTNTKAEMEIQRQPLTLVKNYRRKERILEPDEIGLKRVLVEWTNQENMGIETADK